MKPLLEFDLEGGGSIVVETTDDPSRINRTSRPDEILKDTHKTFEMALEKVKPVAEAVLNKLTSLHQPADEVEVVFGLKLIAEVGAIIASGSAETNFTVRLKWSRKEPKAPSPEGSADDYSD